MRCILLPLLIMATAAGCTWSDPGVSQAGLFISEMSDTGVAEMCEVWSQDPNRVVDRFMDLGFRPTEAFDAPWAACTYYRQQQQLLDS